jgi:hypothetical protein
MLQDPRGYGAGGYDSISAWLESSLWRQFFLSTPQRSQQSRLNSPRE